jgi:hypothetical protein
MTGLRAEILISSTREPRSTIGKNSEREGYSHGDPRCEAMNSGMEEQEQKGVTVRA